MPVAVAAPPLPVSSAPLQAPADGALPSIASADFATLLLGQLSAETGLSKLIADTEVALTPPGDTASTPLDPALLLATMGITGLPIQPEQIVKTSSQAADLSTSGLPGGGVALPQIPGVAQLPASAGDRIGMEATTQVNDSAQTLLTAAVQTGAGGDRIGMEATAQVSDSAPQTPFTAAVQTGGPAKLAGFEPKLADTAQGLIEAAPPLQQLANAVPPGNNGVTNLSRTSESVYVEAALKDQAWPAEFGQKVVWLATQDKQSAQITLNPPQLGPIEISLSVKSDQATAVFASANAEVREAIETALPRLREMLAGVGVELGQTSVSAESFRQSGDNGSNNRNNSGDHGTGNGTGTAIRGETMMLGGTAGKRGNGLVDTFA